MIEFTVRKEGCVIECLEAAWNWWEVWRRCWEVNLSNENLEQRSNQERWEEWIKPWTSMIKLNVDGGLDQKKNMFGTRAICRDDQGQCVGILAVPRRGSISPFNCELMALRNGLLFCLKEGLVHIEGETCCQVISGVINTSEVDLIEHKRSSGR